MRHLITIADDYKTGRTGPVRVKRDQRPSAVVGASADTLPAARRLRVVYGVYWFGNFTGGGDRAANLNLSAEHEASGNADIVNRRGSDRGIHQNGMASVNCGRKTGNVAGRPATPRKLVGSPHGSRITRSSGVRDPFHPPLAGGGAKTGLYSISAAARRRGVNTQSERQVRQ